MWIGNLNNYTTYKKQSLELQSVQMKKVIAVNSETYEDVYGKEITLKFSTEVLKEMEKELED